MHDKDPDKTDISKQLKALQESYAAELPIKVNDIESLWKQLLESQWNDALATDVHRMSHTLVGSGASFGYPDVSNTARRLEIELKALKQSGKAPDKQQQISIEHCIADLRNACNPDPAYKPEYAPHEQQNNVNPQLVLIYDPDKTRQAACLAEELAKFDYLAECCPDMECITGILTTVTPAVLIAIIHDAESIPSFIPLKSGIHYDIPVLIICEDDSFTTRLAAVRNGGNAFLSGISDAGLVVDKIEQLDPSSIKEPYKVLIIDDSKSLATQYAMILKDSGMIAEIVTEPVHVNDMLSSFRPELMLIDMYMPEYNGVELAKVLRQHDSYVGIPIVFLSSETDIDKQIKAMKEGGDDFLTKPIHPDHLISSISNRIERYRVLRAMMENDSLTGLLNHTRIKQRLEIELSRANRENHKLVFAMLDLDNFKQVNDKYGHAVGDQVLRMLSRVLKQRLRRTDIIGRYGGEEFAIILPDSDIPAAETLMNNVREVFSNLPMHAGNETFSITFSCGIAAYPEYSNAASISEAADQALYDAKSAGKNCVRIGRSDT